MRGSFPRERMDELLEVLAETSEGTERVRLIVRDLKTLTRGDEESRELVNVREVIESSINIAWNEIRHRARLVKVFEEVALVEANRARLGQLFLNLLINAAQALNDGHADQDVITVRVRPGDDDGVIVEVSDTGPGISSELRARVFDPFFTTKPVGVGTGLGLSICHRIVTGVGGNIQILDTSAGGTTMQLWFPAAKTRGAPISSSN